MITIQLTEHSMAFNFIEQNDEIFKNELNTHYVSIIRDIESGAGWWQVLLVEKKSTFFFYFFT